MSPRYSHLYKRTERAQSAEITESIRAIYGTSHVLEEHVGGSSWDEEQDNSRSLSSTGNSQGDEVFTDEDISSLCVFIWPLCGKVLVLIELLFNHIMSERENKIVELEKSKYTIGAVLDRFPTSLASKSKWVGHSSY